MLLGNYWIKRNAKAQKAITNKSIAETQKQLQKYYKKCMADTITDFETTYEKLLAQTEKGKIPTPADLYSLDKYYQMQAQLQKRLTTLGDNSMDMLQKQFLKQYTGVYEGIALYSEKSFSTADLDMANQAINHIWCDDGKSWSQRVWGNTAKLQQELNDNLINCIVTGAKTSQLKKGLQERFGVSYNRANTLVRTEMAHIETQAAADRYQKYGLDEYKILVSPDSITCDICAKMEGKKFKYSEMKIGQNAPPFHANCRDCIIPVIK